MFHATWNVKHFFYKWILWNIKYSFNEFDMVSPKFSIDIFFSFVLRLLLFTHACKNVNQLSVWQWLTEVVRNRLLMKPRKARGPNPNGESLIFIRAIRHADGTNLFEFVTPTAISGRHNICKFTVFIKSNLWQLISPLLPGPWQVPFVSFKIRLHANRICLIFTNSAR